MKGESAGALGERVANTSPAKKRSSTIVAAAMIGVVATGVLFFAANKSSTVFLSFGEGWDSGGEFQSVSVLFGSEEKNVTEIVMGDNIMGTVYSPSVDKEYSMRVGGGTWVNGIRVVERSELKTETSVEITDLTYNGTYVDWVSSFYEQTYGASVPYEYTASAAGGQYFYNFSLDPGCSVVSNSTLEVRNFTLEATGATVKYGKVTNGTYAETQENDSSSHIIMVRNGGTIAPVAEGVREGAELIRGGPVMCAPGRCWRVAEVTYEFEVPTADLEAVSPFLWENLTVSKNLWASDKNTITETIGRYGVSYSKYEPGVESYSLAGAYSFFDPLSRSFELTVSYKVPPTTPANKYLNVDWLQLAVSYVHNSTTYSCSGDPVELYVNGSSSLAQSYNVSGSGVSGSTVSLNTSTDDVYYNKYYELDENTSVVLERGGEGVLVSTEVYVESIVGDALINRTVMYKVLVETVVFVEEHVSYYHLGNNLGATPLLVKILKFDRAAGDVSVFASPVLNVKELFVGVDEDVEFV